jgi:hypothetical protein
LDFPSIRRTWVDDQPRHRVPRGSALCNTKLDLKSSIFSWQKRRQAVLTGYQFRSFKIVKTSKMRERGAAAYERC